MPVFIEDRDRKVVPRWRSFVSAAEFRELRPLQKRTSPLVNTRELFASIEEWRRDQSLSAASEIVSVAFSLGCPEHVTDAARFVVSHEYATSAARAIAFRCLSAEQELSPEFTREYDFLGFAKLSEAIRNVRRRLRQNAFNPVLWTNLSLLYTTGGFREKATHAMRVALNLAPDNRFVVRAACRMFLHLGEYERAHAVLLGTSLTQKDPWMLAAELSVAALRNKSSRYLKRARTFIENERYSPFHLSELAGALATIEADSGALRRARQFCAISLLQPAENAIAQASWLDRRNGGFAQVSLEPSIIQSSEANAWAARGNGQWSEALSFAKRWQVEQPFSSRPAMFGGYVACTMLENFDEAEKILSQGLVSNPEDVTLQNNLAFVLAKQDRLIEASAILENAWRLQMSPAERVCLTATEGLVAFRSGRPQEGRLLYRRAIGLANTNSLEYLRHIATVYLAIEEMRLESSTGDSARREAADAVEKLIAPLNEVFRLKLKRACDSRLHAEAAPALSGVPIVRDPH